MNKTNYLHVSYHDIEVGTLAINKQHLVAFEYASSWLNNGFSISPLSLPLEQKVFFPKSYTPFDGLYGVFSDSLPDGWGRLLVDRLLLKQNIQPATVSSLERLAIVGTSGMGALEYRPKKTFSMNVGTLDIDELAVACQDILATKQTDNLDELFQLGGSSGGARPKVNYFIDDEEWIVKFPASLDSNDIGVQEYDYSVCAKRCGIEMAETRLLESKYSAGYFATKRFDRINQRKIHMVSVAGLLETSHRIPNLDYDILMKLTMHLTQSYEEVEKLFRLMCFNVFAHNRDDHAKNFSFLYEDSKWTLSPAYDLTYSNSIGGEHATTIHGNGANPSMKDLLQVAKEIRLDEKTAKDIIAEIQEYVHEDLAKYLT